MDRRTFTLVVAALVLPMLIRYAWFFPGFALPRSVATPDYASLKMPLAPISTAIAAPEKAAAGTVLVDYSHANQFTLSEIGSLANALTQRGAHLVLNTGGDELAAQLRSASSYVVISPSESFTVQQLAQVRSFVARGGRLVVFTDATRGSVQYDFLGNPVTSLPDVDIVTPLLEPFGISVNADYLYDLHNNEGNFRNVYLEPAADSELTKNLGPVTFYGTHSVTTDGGTALLLGGQGTLSSSSDTLPGEAAQEGWAAAAINKAGNVLAFGDFSFLTSPYDLVADNQLLIARVAEYLLHPRAATLADYPYLFGGPTVSVLVSSDLQMTAEMTDVISQMQSVLAGAGLQLKMAERAPSQGDVLVLGTYASLQELDGYVHPFGVKSDDFGEFVSLSPFGKLGQSGNGLLLFRTGAAGNSLVLLADTADDLSSLVTSLVDDGLSGCLVQGNVAACSVGYGGDFMESTPTPEAIPTGGG